MKYDSFNGIYKWSRKDTYICQICSEEVRSFRRMRHTGQHIRDGEIMKNLDDEIEHVIAVEFGLNETYNTLNNVSSVICGQKLPVEYLIFMTGFININDLKDLMEEKRDEVVKQ